MPESQEWGIENRKSEKPSSFRGRSRFIASGAAELLAMDGIQSRAGARFHKSRLQSPSMDFVFRANLRLSKFVPGEFVRIAVTPGPE
jgi:hypothetical protein